MDDDRTYLNWCVGWKAARRASSLLPSHAGQCRPLGQDGPVTDSRPPLAEALDLQPHPEGGWFRQTWATADIVSLPDGRRRPTATLIYFWLPAGESSAWHRVGSDETWLAHEGIVLLERGGDGPYPATEGVEQVRVGVARTAGEVAQAMVPAGVWQRTIPTQHDALVSCFVSPGFDFDDFELAD